MQWIKFTGLMIFISLAGKTLAQDNRTTENKNLVKINLSPVILNSYVMQYERVIKKRQSLGISFGISPKASLPLKQLLINRYGSNTDARDAIEATRYNKYNLTLEYRFYTGNQNAPSGFYLAPFLRYVRINLDENYRFTTVDKSEHLANLKGDLRGVGAGLLAGYQWIITNHFGIDFWIAGPFYGPKMVADFRGFDPVGNLSAGDQAELERRIENLHILGYKIDANVSQNTGGPTSVDVKMRGPYYGIRALGINMVYHF
jgi:hypothetical protein